jgi:hypothetical protein
MFSQEEHFALLYSALKVIIFEVVEIRNPLKSSDNIML